MFPYRFIETDGEAAAEVLRNMNALGRFPELTDLHLCDGWWWLLKDSAGTLCGFAGLLDLTPFPGVGYLKRAYVSPDHRGHGLQFKMIEARVEKARELGWHMVVAETTSPYSARNLAAAGFEGCSPEQPWGEPGSLYFVKHLTAA